MNFSFEKLQIYLIGVGHTVRIKLTTIVNVCKTNLLTAEMPSHMPCFIMTVVYFKNIFIGILQAILYLWTSFLSLRFSIFVISLSFLEC